MLFRSDRYFALNRFMAGRLREAGVPDSRIVIKPNFAKAPSIESAGDRGYALFAGRLSREKGLGVLLDAWRELAPWPLKIAGDGPLQATLAARIVEENLPIELLGMQSREDLWRWLAGANLLIVPSIWFEGMPLVVLEALAMGVPVIGSRIGGLGELLVDHACGLAFEPGDAKSLQVAARRVRDDAALRERLQIGRAHV